MDVPAHHPAPSRLVRAARCWPLLLPLLALGAYAAALAPRMRALVEGGVIWNSDATGPMVMAEALAGPHHGTAYFPTRTPYATLLLDAATRPLPGYRLVWLAWPYVTYLATIALLAVSVRRIAGARAALLAAVVGLGAAPLVLLPVVAQEYHGLTAENAVLLAVLLVTLAGGGRRRVLLPLCVAAGAMTGVQAASDHLLLLTGILPFAAAALVLLWCWRDRAAQRLVVLAGVTLAAAAATGAATVTLGGRLDLVDHPLQVHALGAGGVAHQLRVLGGVVRAALGAPLGYQQTAALGTPELVAGSLLCAGVLVGLAAALHHALHRGRANRGLTAHVIAWTAMAVATVATVVLTDLSVDAGAVRYALVLWPALAAAVAILAARSQRGMVVAAVVATLLVAANAHAIAGLGGVPAIANQAGSALHTADPRDEVARVVAVLQRHGVHKAYAGYWLSDSITWASGGAVRVRPAFQSATFCNPRDARRLCATDWYSLGDWFEKQPGPCAVITAPGASPDAPPSPVYGAPAAVERIGAVTVYVYAHDIGPLRSRYPGSLQ
jgi:hypothetical protein